MTTETERSASRCETFAHALIAMDRMYQAGDLDRATWIASVDSLRLVAARAHLVNMLEHTLADVNDPEADPEYRADRLNELHVAVEIHGDVAGRRVERTTWSPMGGDFAVELEPVR